MRSEADLRRVFPTNESDDCSFLTLPQIQLSSPWSHALPSEAGSFKRMRTNHRTQPTASQSKPRAASALADFRTSCANNREAPPADRSAELWFNEGDLGP